MCRVRYTYIHTYIRTVHLKILCRRHENTLLSHFNSLLDTYIHTYIHIYTHTYVYTYIHTYIQTYIYKASGSVTGEATPPHRTSSSTWFDPATRTCPSTRTPPWERPSSSATTAVAETSSSWDSYPLRTTPLWLDSHYIHTYIHTYYCTYIHT